MSARSQQGSRFGAGPTSMSPCPEASPCSKPPAPGTPRWTRCCRPSRSRRRRSRNRRSKSPLPTSSTKFLTRNPQHSHNRRGRNGSGTRLTAKATPRCSNANARNFKPCGTTRCAKATAVLTPTPLGVCGPSALTRWQICPRTRRNSISPAKAERSCRVAASRSRASWTRRTRRSRRSTSSSAEPSTTSAF